MSTVAMSPTSVPAPAGRSALWKSLFVQVLAALLLGIRLAIAGAHGVPGSAIVIRAATLNAVPSIPAVGLVLVLSVDWFIGMARALGNLIGNCIATVVIAAREGDLDHAVATRVSVYGYCGKASH